MPSLRHSPFEKGGMRGFDFGFGSYHRFEYLKELLVHHTSPDYSLLTVSKGECSGAKTNRPVPWSGLQTQFVKRTPGENASGESSTKNIIEAVRLGVFTPPGSPFDRHRIVVFPLSMNNPG